MSSLSSPWSRTMSTISKSTMDTTTSVPHTPSSTSSVITGLKASLGSGPFFHAHLQEGQRIEDRPRAGAHYEVSAYAIGPKDAFASHTFPRKPNKAAVKGSISEERPRVSQRHTTGKNMNGVDSSSIFTMSITPMAGVSQQAPLAQTPAKKRSRSASATAMPSDNTDFWSMVAEVQATVNGATSIPQRYHYITRSQSASAASDANHISLAPKMRKQNASYSPGIGTPAYHDSVGTVPATLTGPATLYPTRGRCLSPIEEVQCFPEKQGDAASLNSMHSAQSNLFIHRSVRRTPSASTLNSVTSRSPDSLSAPYGTAPSRSHGQPRPVASLPVIPASPRESQNVFEQDAVSQENVSLAYPMPVAYPDQSGYTVRNGVEEQDLGETLSTLRFAVPHRRSRYDGRVEQDLGDGFDPRASTPHSGTPSLLSRSESVPTELTYLTAQDSANSRRASAISQEDLEAGHQIRSPFADGDTTLVNTPKPSPAARLKASLDTLLSKSPKMRKSPGGATPATPTVDAASTFSTSPKIAKILSHMQEGLKKNAPWGEGKGKPAEVLFWVGFVAPWCWLIGGWMLSRSGETMAEGLPSGAKEPELPHHSTSRLHLQSDQQRSREMRVIPVPADAATEKNGTETTTSIWQAAKASSTELLETLRGHGKHSQEGAPPFTVRAIALHGDVPIPIMISTRVDPWVTRCRVAAIVSGMFILALCIVALVVLVRSL